MKKRRKKAPQKQSLEAKEGVRTPFSLVCDGLLLLSGVALIVGAAYAFLTRPEVSYSISAEAGTARCRFADVSVFDGERLVDRPPHLHLAITSLAVNATALTLADSDSSFPLAAKHNPLTPTGFASINCIPQASIRVFMVPDATMTVMSPGEFSVRDRTFQIDNALPSNYSLGLVFDYPKDATVWTIMASQDVVLRTRVFEYSTAEQIPADAMAGALATGYSWPFLSAPAAFDAPFQLPIEQEVAHLTIPGGICLDYYPTMFVSTPPGSDPLSGSPVSCSALELSDVKGSITVDGNSRSVYGARSVIVPVTSAELRFAPASGALSILARGDSSSIRLDGAELVPSRAGRFGLQEPF